MNNIQDKEFEEKKEMINKILQSVKNADGDLFFTLAFRTNKELKAICKEIGI